MTKSLPGHKESKPRLAQTGEGRFRVADFLHFFAKLSNVVGGEASFASERSRGSRSCAPRRDLHADVEVLLGVLAGVVFHHAFVVENGIV